MDFTGTGWEGVKQTRLCFHSVRVRVGQGCTWHPQSDPSSLYVACLSFSSQNRMGVGVALRNEMEKGDDYS